MSDRIIRVIPTDPYYYIDRKTTQQIVDRIKWKIAAENVELKIYDTPAFIDCGSYLEKITCPACGENMDFDWWGTAMDAAWNNRFMDLSIKLPCCGRNSTLNDLQYDFPCGFSCMEINILNPLAELDQEDSLYIQKLIGTPVRCIQAHI